MLKGFELRYNRRKCQTVEAKHWKYRTQDYIFLYSCRRQNNETRKHNAAHGWRKKKGREEREQEQRTKAGERWECERNKALFSMRAACAVQMEVIPLQFGYRPGMGTGYYQAVRCLNARWCVPASGRRSEKVCSFTRLPLSPSFTQDISLSRSIHLLVLLTQLFVLSGVMCNIGQE